MPPAQEESLAGLPLVNRQRWVEVGRILLTGLLALLYWRAVIPFGVLLAAVALGLFPLVKAGVLGLIRERKIGTELFVTIATLIAILSGETIAGAVLLAIILIAEFIAELNTVRGDGGERAVPIGELQRGDVVLVRGRRAEAFS